MRQMRDEENVRGERVKDASNESDLRFEERLGVNERNEV